MRGAPWKMGEGANEWTACPVCGVPWRPAGGSLLPCHAKCLFTPELQDELLDEAATERAQAERLGVTKGIVRASLHAARRRRATR